MHDKAILPEVHLPAREVDLDPLLAARLIEAARAAAERAYASFSNFPVGSALIMADDPTGEIITGANVENSAYGETLCAERTALNYAVAKGYRKLALIALTTPKTRHSPLCDRSPCGACRQVIHEFATPDTLVLIDTPSGIPEVLDLPRLLPHAFRIDPPVS